MQNYLKNDYAIFIFLAAATTVAIIRFLQLENIEKRRKMEDDETDDEIKTFGFNQWVRPRAICLLVLAFGSIPFMACAKWLDLVPGVVIAYFLLCGFCFLVSQELGPEWGWPKAEYRLMQANAISISEVFAWPGLAYYFYKGMRHLYGFPQVFDLEDCFMIAFFAILLIATLALVRPPKIDELRRRGAERTIALFLAFALSARKKAETTHNTERNVCA